MKRTFITGLVILLPVVITAWILALLINFLTKPFLDLVQATFQHYIQFHLPITVLTFISKTVILIMIGVFILLIGFLGSWVFLHYFLKWADYIVHRIPLVNNIYKATKDFIHSLLSPTSPSFSQVVLAPFPDDHALCVGLVSKEKVMVQVGEKESFSEMVSVFIPGTPNPSVGFLLMYRKEQLIYTDLKIDEAMKMVISCGVMLPEFTIKS